MIKEKFEKYEVFLKKIPAMVLVEKILPCFNRGAFGDFGIYSENDESKYMMYGILPNQWKNVFSILSKPYVEIMHRDPDYEVTLEEFIECNPEGFSFVINNIKDQASFFLMQSNQSQSETQKLLEEAEGLIKTKGAENMEADLKVLEGIKKEITRLIQNDRTLSEK